MMKLIYQNGLPKLIQIIAPDDAPMDVLRWGRTCCQIAELHRTCRSRKHWEEWGFQSKRLITNGREQIGPHSQKGSQMELLFETVPKYLFWCLTSRCSIVLLLAVAKTLQTCIWQSFAVVVFMTGYAQYHEEQGVQDHGFVLPNVWRQRAPSFAMKSSRKLKSSRLVPVISFSSMATVPADGLCSVPRSQDRELLVDWRVGAHCLYRSSVERMGTACSNAKYGL
jgi:hypothetical protein